MKKEFKFLNLLCISRSMHAHVALLLFARLACTGSAVMQRKGK